MNETVWNEKIRSTDKKTEIYYFLLCVLWFFLSFKPEWTVPGLRFISPIPTLIQLTLFIVWFFQSGKKINNPISKYFLLLLIWMTVSSIFARNTGLARTTLQSMFYLYIIYVVTTSFANNEKRILRLFAIFILGNVYIAILAVIYGGRVPGVPIFGDENDLALGMNMIIPLTLFLGASEKTLLKKALYFLATGILILAVVLTFSRGGYIGLIALLLFAWAKVPYNKIKSTIAAVILALLVSQLAPESFWNKLKTINEGAKEHTADARIYLWTIAAREFADNPIMGVGLSNFGVWLQEYVRPDDMYLSGNPVGSRTIRYGEVAHSIYFTLLSELGIVGVTLFILMLYHWYKSVRPDKRLDYQIKSKNDILQDSHYRKNLLTLRLFKINSLSLGLMGGMIGYFITGAFLAVTYYQQFWLLCALGVALEHCRKTFAEEAGVSLAR